MDDVTSDATQAMTRFERAGLLAAESCRSSGDGYVWVVNVAGPRESESPGIGERAERFLREVFQPAR